MRHEWVMDVLADLRRFAGEQHMRELELALSVAAQVAALELSNLHGSSAAQDASPAPETPPAV